MLPDLVDFVDGIRVYFVAGADGSVKIKQVFWQTSTAKVA